MGMNSWKKRAISFIRKIQNDKYTLRDIQNLQDELRKLLAPKASDENQEYINGVFSRINDFVKTVETDFIPDINRMTTEIQNDFIKSNHRNEVWKKLYQSLVIDGNAIWKLRNDVIQIRDEYLSNKGVKNEEDEMTYNLNLQNPLHPFQKLFHVLILYAV